MAAPTGTWSGGPTAVPTWPRSGGRPARSRRGAARSRQHADRVALLPAERARADAVAADAGDFYLTVDEIPGRLTYRPYGESATGNKHHGQVKLLMHEVFFLTKYAIADDTAATAGAGAGAPPGPGGTAVVYVAGAPGDHTPYLAELFPTCEFYLYDPAPFNIKEAGRIHLFQEFFTDELAARWGPEGDLRRDFEARAGPGARVLLVNDIRSAAEAMSFADFEARVAADNEAQARWYRTVRPDAATIKHRWPFGPAASAAGAAAKMSYPEGTRYVQAYPPPLSAETRLVIDGPDAPDVEYDTAEYEQRLFYHNMIVRRFARYEIEPEILEAVPGLEPNYDGKLAVEIWREFLAAGGPPPEAGSPPAAGGGSLETAAQIAALITGSMRALKLRRL